MDKFVVVVDHYWPFLICSVYYLSAENNSHVVPEAKQAAVLVCLVYFISSFLLYASGRTNYFIQKQNNQNMCDVGIVINKFGIGRAHV